MTAGDGTSAQSKPTLLLFYDPRDGRARRVEGYLAQVLQRRRNHETFVVQHIDVAERPDLAARLRVSSTPALLVLSDNRVIARLEQPRSSIEIQTVLSPWLR